MYMTIRSRMSSIIDLMRPKLSELSALELENLPYLTLFYTLASANFDQSVPNLATMYMPIRSQMSLIMGDIELKRPELFALELIKIAESDFVYSSTNVLQLVPNMITMYTDRKKFSKFFISLVFVYKSMSLKCFRIEQLCPSIGSMMSLVFVHYAIM